MWPMCAYCSVKIVEGDFCSDICEEFYYEYFDSQIGGEEE